MWSIPSLATHRRGECLTRFGRARAAAASPSVILITRSCDGRNMMNIIDIRLVTSNHFKSLKMSSLLIMLGGKPT